MRSTERPDNPSEEYRSLFESMTDGFAFHEIITDESGRPCDYRFLDINPAFERQIGLKRADILGKRVLEVIPGLEPFWIETYGRVALTGEPAHFENFSASLNRWYQVYAYRPGPLQFAAVFSDITERKTTEITERKKAEEALKDFTETLERRVAERTEALRASEEKYRGIVETAQEGIAVGSPDGCFVFVNRKMADLLGYEPDEIIGKNSLDFMDVEEKDNVFRSRTELKKGQIIHREYKFRRKNGTPLWTYCSASPLFDQAGGHLGNLSMHSDITERKADEERAKHLASFPEINPNPIIEINKSGEVTYSNPATRRILGDLKRGAEEIGAFLPPDMPDLLRKLKDNKATSHYREMCIGERFFGEGIHLVPQFGVARIYAFDITERKKTEEELKRSNENLEQYAYVASHDLQEPLRILASYSQLLAKRYKDKLDPDADDFIGFITGAASRMQKLISDLLAYSRIGRKDSSLTEVDCNAVVRTVIDSLAASFESCRGRASVAQLPVVRAHETSLTQLFQNLIGNALKFRSEEPPRIEIGAARRGREWVFSVRDNGIGIEPPYRERIFMIFQRLHTQDAYPGTGIGLAICKKIVENHGGRIWCESEPGRGSTFYFSFPAGESPHE